MPYCSSLGILQDSCHRVPGSPHELNIRCSSLLYVTEALIGIADAILSVSLRETRLKDTLYVTYNN